MTLAYHGLLNLKCVRKYKSKKGPRATAEAAKAPYSLLSALEEGFFSDLELTHHSGKKVILNYISFAT